ncbi:MAG: S41 family peptidase [Candidatus Liptonbacteria bacterium]|nr:S41 family peptidase [Candidatus Liptonbacteria bacterium]
MFTKTTGKKILIAVAVLAAGAVLLGSGFFIGFRAGEKFPKTVTVKELTNTTSGQPGSVDFGTFWQAWESINESYLKSKEVNSQDKVYGAIGGLVSSLGDPYSLFLSPKKNEKFQEDIQGNFGGIGAEIGVKKNQLMVVAPLKDTPASRAGLKAGDKIFKINATSTEGMAVDEAVQLIRGPKKSEVTLTIFRDGWDQAKDFKIIRDTILIPTLDYSMKDGDIAYVQLYSFNANAEQLFYQSAAKALSEGARGMILDLRDNPGGYLDVAVGLAGWFVPRGTLVVKEESSAGVIQELKAAGNAALVKFPVVVLINGGSASASEILAGSLRDDRGVKLVGEKSFGKGTVQELIPLRDNSYLKLTIAHWVLPSGKILENGGLDPDIAVKITDDDIKNKRDPQLDKAIETLKSEIQNSKS